jgi:HAD superfamily hydrolase (TIGR01549 family)
MLKAICFDLGSTLWDDYPTLLHMWERLAVHLSERGIRTTRDDMAADARRVIQSYAPSLTRAIVWQRVGRDTALYTELMRELVRENMEHFSDPGEFTRLNPLFPGVHELLEGLAGRYKLAVVSQHFRQVAQWMEHHDLRRYFSVLAISGKERIYKPDPRLYELACGRLGVAPEETMMVGDRLDNDIWPANRMEMTTVRVLSEPYRHQEPRYPRDVPDYTIEHVADLGSVVEGIEES